ncbi:DNA polymerase I [Thalassocella blandensis]|nr:DNA polymerase I [Thalassocella blandensis]
MLIERNGEHLYIIDASIYIFKYYFTMPDRWRATNGRPTETVYGYALWLYRFLRDQQPARVVACFDESLTSCFRNEIYSGYKQSRELPDDDLAFQLLACKRITELMGVSCYASQRYEADDLIGTFAHTAFRDSVPYVILSRDKDLSQLLFSDEAALWNYPDDEPLRAACIKEKLGVKPAQVADFLALVGDAIDDIPGVPGVGKKTAIALLEHFGSWAEIKQNVNTISTLKIRGAKSLQQKLLDYSAQVDISLQLATIVTDVEEIVGLEPYKSLTGDGAETIPWGNTVMRGTCLSEELVELSKGLGFPDSFYQNIEKNLT